MLCFRVPVRKAPHCLTKKVLESASLPQIRKYSKGAELLALHVGAEEGGDGGPIDVQTDAGTTTLLVTHDQEEALTSADRIGVMCDERIVQLDTPEAIYRRPATAFVSESVGVTNRIPAVLDGNRIRVFGRNLGIDNLAAAGSNGTSLEAPIRPADLALSHDSAGSALVTSPVLREAITSVNVRSEEPDQALRIDMPAHDAMSFTVGHRVVIIPRRDTILVGNSNAALEEEDAA